MKSNDMSESNIFAYNIIAQLRPFSIVQLIIYSKLVIFFCDICFVMFLFYKDRYHFSYHQNNYPQNGLFLLTHISFLQLSITVRQISFRRLIHVRLRLSPIFVNNHARHFEEKTDNLRKSFRLRRGSTIHWSERKINHLFLTPEDTDCFIAA